MAKVVRGDEGRDGVDLGLLNSGLRDAGARRVNGGGIVRQSARQTVSSTAVP